jgi:N-acetylmuramoyl-L-alanine amidase
VSSPQPIQLPSPNCDSRDGHPIDMLVLHYTGMRSCAAALDRLIDPSAKVSAHYAVDEDGGIWQLVPEEMRAWHAGKSFWRGETNINQRSIGIEIVNPGHEFGYRPFPIAQMQSVIALCKAILSRHTIPERNIVAHSDIAPTRKMDPGELFDWAWLAREGIGEFPFPTQHPTLQDLAAYGYDVSDEKAVKLAFQRRFSTTIK